MEFQPIKKYAISLMKNEENEGRANDPAHKFYEIPHTLKIIFNDIVTDDKHSNGFNILETGEIKSMHGFIISYQEEIKELVVRIRSYEQDEYDMRRFFLKKGENKISVIKVEGHCKAKYDFPVFDIDKSFISSESIIEIDAPIVFKVPEIYYENLTLNSQKCFFVFQEKTQCAHFIAKCSSTSITMNKIYVEKAFIVLNYSKVYDLFVEKSLTYEVKDTSVINIIKKPHTEIKDTAIDRTSYTTEVFFE